MENYEKIEKNIGGGNFGRISLVKRKSDGQAPPNFFRFSLKISLVICFETNFSGFRLPKFLNFANKRGENAGIVESSEHYQIL